MKPVSMNYKTNKLIVISGILSPFIGIFAGIYGIDQIENYFHPYLFSSICSIIGLSLGWIFSILIKPYTEFNKKQLKNYSITIMFFSSGFIGLMLAIGSLVNSGLSIEIDNDNYTVIDKTFKESKFRSPGARWLHISYDGRIEKLRCKGDYWNNTQIHQQINISTYKSKIGFDYLVMTDE